MGKLVETLLRKGQTVFSFSELRALWPMLTAASLKSRLHYAIKQGDLYHIHRGIYAKNANYDRLEVAGKLYSPSYISFETVLRREAINFQYHEEILIAASVSKSMIIDGQRYTFRKLKNSILLNLTGINCSELYCRASGERAMLDALYINHDYYFDVIDYVNWERLDEILEIYQSKRMERLVQDLKKRYEDER